MTRIIAKPAAGPGPQQRPSGAPYEGIDDELRGVVDATATGTEDSVAPHIGTTDVHQFDAADGDFPDVSGEAVADEEADSPSIVLRAGGAAAGERLDRFLAARLPTIAPDRFADLSRTRVQRWIALGAVHCDGRVLPSKARLSGVETIVVEPQPREADSAFAPEPIALELVWRDAALLIVDKPAGLVVHPAAGNWHGTLLNGLLHLDPSLAALPRAGIVHRLDKDTSGLLVVARTESAMATLAAQLADRSMGRRYLALVVGDPGPTGTIDAPIARDPRSRVRMAVVAAAHARAARTHFRRLAGGSLDGLRVTLLECRLETGRTHQIRVHLAHTGHPLVGDTVYGGPVLAGFARQALHAWRLELLHPDRGARRGWQAAPPSDFVALLAAAGIDAGVIAEVTGNEAGTLPGDAASALPGGQADAPSGDKASLLPGEASEPRR